MAKTPKKKYSEGDIVEIRCVDITMDAGWITIDAVRKMIPAPVKAVGYFLEEDETCITILTLYSMDEKEEEGGYIIFPKALVRSVELIQESELDDFKESK